MTLAHPIPLCESCGERHTSWTDCEKRPRVDTETLLTTFCDLDHLAPRPPIIGITGRIGSGKTTAAFHLMETFGFKRRRFAGPLKHMLHCLGLTPAHTDGSLKEKPCAILGGRTPRHAMQTLGTEWGRNCVADDLWIRAWRATLPDDVPVVVDDVRFANEAAAIVELGGTTIRIVRPVATQTASTHASEHDMFRVSHTLHNEGSIDDLEAAVGKIAVDLLSDL